MSQSTIEKDRLMRRLALLALIVGIVLLTGGALLVLRSRQPRQPMVPTFGAISGDNHLVETREILFMSNRDGDWDIYVLALSDRSVTNLTDNDADDGFGAYSADGGAITFLSNRNGALDPFMMNADGSDARPVANDLPTIFSVIASGRLNWDFAARAQDQAALVSLRDLNLEIYLKDAGGERNLTHDGAVDWYPAWSPNGDRIAFASDRDGNQEIYVMAADGGNPRRLTDAPGDDLYPMWWGNIVYFMSDRDIPFANGQIGLYALNLDDTDPQAQRLSAAAPVSFLDEQIWQPDGTRIFAANDDGDWDIYAADSVRRNKVNLTDNNADDLFAVWRPQGS